MNRAITVTSNVGVGSLAYDRYTVFPNPSSGIFNISGAGDLHGSFVVYDLKGIAIVTGVISVNNYILDLTKFGKGVYFLNVTTKDKTEISRLIVK